MFSFRVAYQYKKQLTHGNRFNENQLDAVAGHIRNLGNRNYSKPELINKLREVYTYIAKKDSAMNECTDITKPPP